MKPDWKDAPEWADYLAMDGDGEWYWFEVEPRKPVAGTTWGANGGTCVFAGTGNLNFRDSLEFRPEGGT